MKRVGFKKKVAPLRKKKLVVAGHLSVKQQKQDIQDLLRAVVIKRDGGCVLRRLRNCGGEIGEAVLQADHLIERSHSATYADSRLVVCVCRGCHGWKHFKKSNHDHYNYLIKQVITKARVKLWEDCEKDSWRAVPKRTHDWNLAIVALKQEAKKLGTTG